MQWPGRRPAQPLTVASGMIWSSGEFALYLIPSLEELHLA
jgi:hypothetical protein